MIDGNEDEIGPYGFGQTAFEKKNNSLEENEEDSEDFVSSKRDDESDGGKGGGEVQTEGEGTSCPSSSSDVVDDVLITKASKTRQTWAFKASSMQYAHMPTHATHGALVVLAFHCRESEDVNQRIYLVRSEDGGKTFDSFAGKREEVERVSCRRWGKSSFSERNDAEVQAQWGPALFKEENEDEENVEDEKNRKKIPLLRLYYSQSESCFFCRQNSCNSMDAKEYRAGETFTSLRRKISARRGRNRN